VGSSTENELNEILALYLNHLIYTPWQTVWNYLSVVSNIAFSTHNARKIRCFKRITGNNSLEYKSLIARSKLSSYPNIHTCTWTPSGGRTYSCHRQMYSYIRWHSIALQTRRVREGEYDTHHYLLVKDVRKKPSRSKLAA